MRNDDPFVCDVATFTTHLDANHAHLCVTWAAPSWRTRLPIFLHAKPPTRAEVCELLLIAGYANLAFDDQEKLHAYR